MKWYWKVRLCKPSGHYWHAQVETEQELREIEIIQDFYLVLTGGKMLLEGMSDKPYTLASPQEAFEGLWGLREP